MGELNSAIAVAVGVMVVSSGLIGLVVFAFIRRFDQERDKKQGELMVLQKEELTLYRQRADRVPELQQQVEVLREEVGAAKAIAALDGKVTTELARINERIAAHDERARRADEHQAAANAALLEGINALLMHVDREPIRVQSAPGGPRGRG